MSKPKIQQEFEEWVKGRWPNTVFDQFSQGEYCGFTLEHCWQAWQASRAALVIELPEATQAGGPDDEIYWPADVHAVIEAAGLKVKS